MSYLYHTKGTCSKLIEVELDGNIVKYVKFTGGCNGNLKGICALVQGMKVEEVIDKLKGIRCGFKPTSCPDQLACGLEEAECHTHDEACFAVSEKLACTQERPGRPGDIPMTARAGGPLRNWSAAFPRGRTTSMTAAAISPLLS